MTKSKHDDGGFGEAAPAVAAAPDEDRARRAASSIGAQIVLDYNSPAGIGARGGAAADMVGNTAARDRYLVALGLDPNAPSGPPPLPLTGRATRMSSLATSDPEPLPAVPDEPPPPL